MWAVPCVGICVAFLHGQRDECMHACCQPAGSHISHQREGRVQQLGCVVAKPAGSACQHAAAAGVRLPAAEAQAHTRAAPQQLAGAACCWTGCAAQPVARACTGAAASEHQGVRNNTLHAGPGLLQPEDQLTATRLNGLPYEGLRSAQLPASAVQGLPAACRHHAGACRAAASAPQPQGCSTAAGRQLQLASTAAPW